jgi:hypothetical protein
MQAVLNARARRPDVLRLKEVARPRPGDGEVLITGPCRLRPAVRQEEAPTRT